MPNSPYFSPFLHRNEEGRSIGCFRAEISHPGNNAGRGTLRVSFAPYPRLRIFAKGKEVAPRDHPEFGTLKLGVPDPKLGVAVNSFHGQQSVTRKSISGRSWASWQVRGFLDVPIPANKPRIGHIVGHLYNFNQFLGSGDLVQYQEGHGIACRTNWNFGPYILHLDSFWLGDEYTTAVEDDQFFLTHIFYVEREAKNLFGADDASDLCWFLEIAFAFIAGNNVGPSLVAGRRIDDPFVWIWPGPKLLSAKGRRGNWSFAHRHTNCLSILGPMWQAWTTPSKKDWLTRGIPIYIEAARDDLPWDVRIAVAQTGLEMMASLILTEMDKVLTIKEYEGLHTAGQLRALLEHLNVDTVLPLWARCKPKKANGDLVDAVTDIRNAIIHPTRSNRGWLNQQDGLALYHAWSVLLEYLELSVLYATGYQGKYSSCMKSGAFDQMPWRGQSRHSKTTIQCLYNRRSERKRRTAGVAIAGFLAGLFVGCWLRGRNKL